MKVCISRTSSMERMSSSMTSSNSSSVAQTSSTMTSNAPAVTTTYSISGIAARRAATRRVSPLTRRPIVATTPRPSATGSVTATIRISPDSRSRLTRWRAAASDSPTASPISP